MNEKELLSLEKGLNKLIKKYKQNLKKGDDERLRATEEVKSVVRRILLISSVKGEMDLIKPIYDKKKGFGWEVKDEKGKIKQLFKNIL